MNLSAKHLQNNCDFHGYKLISETIDGNQSDVNFETSLTTSPSKRLNQITALGIGFLTSIAAIGDYHIEQHIKNTSYIYKIDKNKLDDFDIHNGASLFITELTEEEQIAVVVTDMKPILPMPPTNTRKVKFKINNRRKGLPSLI